MAEPTPAQRSARVHAIAGGLGFDLVGVAPTSVPQAFERYARQMAAGYGAEMGWLHERPQLRRDVRAVWARARSVIVVGVGYASQVPGYLASPPAADEGWIARYAQGRDYHAYVRKLLVRFAKALAADPLLGAGGDSRDHRVFTDTGPVLEKAFAQAAGLGWIGKNTLLIHRGGGSWYLLGVVLTPLALAPDTPETDHCGACRRCLDVCPTGALVEPYVLDARRCIATWTIESPDPAAVIDPEAVGQHVFGCDLCQEVCPHNHRPASTSHAPLAPRPQNVRPKLAELAGLDEAAFKARFPNSAVRRVTASRMSAVVDAIRGRK
ncbi:MAG: tRNA epoxyqueuosine(34) reductase QueG [Proteobacteria bacterium]|nr:MAG: tRNA epoxyqueuosine(34) reductase QueG [Pseudomonadota bacterium]